MEYQTGAFFLGTNSKYGFVSFFEEAIQESPARSVYVVKSGPGCGKSTMMARIARALEQSGMCEMIHCASDPASLDGVIMHERGLMIVDGTAPHVIEPAFPGAAGGYLTSPAFRAVAALREKRAALTELAANAKKHYAQAYRLIAASAAVDESIRARVRESLDTQRLARRASGIIAREVPKTGQTGRLYKRFIDAISPDGVLRRYDTVERLAQNVYDLQDHYGFAGVLLEPICASAVERGHTVYACFSAKDPGRLLHLILPELSLAFVTSDGTQQYPGRSHRRIRIDAYIDRETHKPARGRCKLMSRIAAGLLGDAVAELAAAKALHDDIESLYAPHIDFAALDAMTERLIAEMQAESGQ